MFSTEISLGPRKDFPMLIGPAAKSVENRKVASCSELQAELYRGGPESKLASPHPLVKLNTSQCAWQ